MKETNKLLKQIRDLLVILMAKNPKNLESRYKEIAKDMLKKEDN